MAPRLPPSKLEMIRNLIYSGSLTTIQMADAAGCSKRPIANVRSNLRLFGNVRAPSTRVGRRRSITPPMIHTLCDHLLEKFGLYVDEMVLFLWDEFHTWVTSSSLKRALVSVGWSKKVAKHRAKKQNADLRDFYLHNLSDFKSHHLVYVDESGCYKRIGFRRTGWSPLGLTPLQVSKFYRDQRYQILPAYAQDGVILSRVFQGSTDAAVFEDFIERLLKHCEERNL
ncbi:putative TPR domain protein [Aspergillus affinis]|uniref:putative TPR domain protein n=1 Tax=Aspergillus affinis TaxID=1070780 RepID=UPI0022FE56A2|nr:putative TPR domain protein [Aspergillus affinis]KAI9041829.1 putative TPR domain protein [Aspergillus affinis]